MAHNLNRIATLALVATAFAVCCQVEKAPAARGDPEDVAMLLRFDLSRAPRRPLWVQLDLGPGCWQRPDTNVLSALPKPFRQDHIATVGYKSDRRTAGLGARTRVLIRDLRPPRATTNNPASAAGASGSQETRVPALPARARAPVGTSPIRHYFRGFMKSLEASGWVLGKPLDRFDQPRTLKGAGYKVRLHVGKFIGTDPRWISSATGRPEPEAHLVVSFCVDQWLVALIIEDQRDEASKILDGLQLSKRKEAPKRALVAKFALSNVAKDADGNDLGASITLKAPREYRRQYRNGHGAQRPSGSTSTGVGRWMRTASDGSSRFMYLTATTLALPLDEAVLCWLKLHAAEYETEGGVESIRLPGNRVGFSGTSIRTQGESVSRVVLFWFQVGNELMTLEVQAEDSTKKSIKRMTATMRSVQRSLRFGTTRPFRVPSTAK